MSQRHSSRSLLFNPSLLAGYRQLLRTEGWTPGASGADPSECDTIPLFSRYAHLSFLDDLRIADKEAALLAMAFWYWLEVETTLVSKGHSLPYVNDISFMDWDSTEEELPKPVSLFCANARLLQRCRQWSPRSNRSNALLASLRRLGLDEYAIVHEQPVDRDLDCTVIDFWLGSSPHKMIRWESLRE